MIFLYMVSYFAICTAGNGSKVKLNIEVLLRKS